MWVIPEASYQVESLAAVGRPEEGRRLYSGPDLVWT
jgi:hypothetical protein